MALTYVAPNFDSDVDFDVADATAVKGGAPAAGDKFWVVAGATFTVESDLACLQVILGRTSAGAAGAGNRYGLVVQNGGTKITFDGAAAITDSGIYVNPTSADASSKGCKVTIPGTSASKAQWDVSVQWDTNYRFQLHMRYGYCDIDYLQILANTSYTSGVYQIVTHPHTIYAPEGVTFKINHAEFPHIYGIAVYLGANTNGDRNLPFEAKYCIMDTYSDWTHIFICDNCYGTISSGDIDFTGFTWISNSASSYNKIIFRTFIQKFPLYISNNRASFVNNLPTQVVPTNPAATDPGTNGDLTVTWANGASYTAGDKVFVYNNADDSVLGILDATAGTGIITGLTNGVEYTMYLKATSDNYNFSDETATFTGTPTAPNNTWPDDDRVRLPDTWYENDVEHAGIFDADAYAVAFEAPRNTNPGIANVLPVAYKIKGVDYTGEKETTTPVTPTGFVLADEEISETLSFAITNIGSFDATDILEVRDSTNVLKAAISVADYNLAGEGYIFNLTDDVAVTLKCRAYHSGATGVVYSSYSNTDTETPTNAATYPNPHKVERSQATYGPTGVEYDPDYIETAADDLRIDEEVGDPTDPTVGTLVPSIVVTPATWTSGPTMGDGQAVIHITAPSPTAVIYARYRLYSDVNWSAESELLKRTGSGNITITGLTNNSVYVFSGYVKESGVESSWLACLNGVPIGPAADTDTDDREMASVVTFQQMCAIVEVAELD